MHAESEANNKQRPKRIALRPLSTLNPRLQTLNYTTHVSAGAPRMVRIFLVSAGTTS